MKVKLTHRNFGIHETVSEAEIPGSFAEYAVPSPGNEDRDEWEIDERKLLDALPSGFLPVRPASVLLGVSEENGGTAHSGTTVFRRWAKYFDAYMLWLVREVTADDPEVTPEFRQQAAALMDRNDGLMRRLAGTEEVPADGN